MVGGCQPSDNRRPAASQPGSDGNWLIRLTLSGGTGLPTAVHFGDGLVDQVPCPRVRGLPFHLDRKLRSVSVDFSSL